MFSLYSSLASFSGAVIFFISHGVFPTNHIFSPLDTPPNIPRIELRPFHPSSPTAATFALSPQQVTIADLFRDSQDYHQQVVSVQGLITQPELHLDETELYLDFVFRLSQGTLSIIVYGRHDRTLGAPAIRMNQSVEVIGTFFKEQDREGSVLLNVLEAISVMPYPSSIPESA